MRLSVSQKICRWLPQAAISTGADTERHCVYGEKLSVGYDADLMSGSWDAGNASIWVPAGFELTHTAPGGKEIRARFGSEVRVLVFDARQPAGQFC